MMLHVIWVLNAFTTGRWGCIKEVRSYVGVPFGALGDEKSACHGPNTKRMARRGCDMTEKTSRMYLHTGGLVSQCIYNRSLGLR